MHSLRLITSILTTIMAKFKYFSPLTCTIILSVNEYTFKKMFCVPECKGVGSPETGVTSNYKLSFECREPNPDRL